MLNRIRSRIAAWKDWLLSMIRVLIAARDSDGTTPFPPMPLCPICQFPTIWLVVSERWHCTGPDTHAFTERDPDFINVPLPRMPGDEGDNRGEY